MTSQKMILRVAVSLWSIFLARKLVAEPTVPVDGPSFDAKLQAIDESWNLQFAGPAGEIKKLPAAKIVQWGTWPEPRSAKFVALADGSTLAVADVLGIQNDKLLVESDSLATPTVRLPLATVAGVVFQAPLSRRQRATLEDQLLAATGDSDRVLLANGDELAGTIASLNEMSLQLKSALSTAPLEVARLKAISLNPRLRAKPAIAGLRAWIALRDGSRLQATKLATKGTEAQITLAGGTMLRVPLDEIVAMQPVGGDVTYLSDLKPAGYKHIPFLNLRWEYQNNRSAEGNSLHAGGQRWEPLDAVEPADTDDLRPATRPD